MGSVFVLLLDLGGGIFNKKLYFIEQIVESQGPRGMGGIECMHWKDSKERSKLPCPPPSHLSSILGNEKESDVIRLNRQQYNLCSEE